MRVRFQLWLLSVIAVGGWCHEPLNETALEAFPPLHGLDPWTQCQREGDIYCTVDAKLVSERPSSLLEYIQEYSSDLVRHYNRTLVHRGVCVSRCGAPETGAKPWHSAAAACINRELASYDLQAEVVSVQYCASPEPHEASTNTRAFAGVVVVMIALVVLATAVHVLGERCAKVDGNKYLLAFSLKRNWQILTYNRAKPRSDQRMKDLSCIEGFRFVAVQMVINSHIIILGQHTFSSNPEFFEKLFESAAGQIVANAAITIGAFFSLSGFLTTYCVLITIDKSPITLWKCFLSIVNRYIRLTPPAAIMLWFTITWAPLLGSGPQWGWFMQREAQDCSERWWYHLVYAQNYLPMGKMCQGHTWYLAADIQLHIIGMLVLLFICKFRKAVAPTLVLLVVGSAATCGLLSYFYDIGPLVLGYSPESIRLNFLDSKVVSMLYLPVWVNIGSYAGGMATAFILHHVQTKGFKLNQNKWFGLLFHAAPTLYFLGVALGIVFLRYDLPLWARVLYTTTDRPVITMFFNIMLLGCIVGCKGFIPKVLEWRGFHFLGRLTFSAYLIHFTVLRIFFGYGTELTHISLFKVMTMLISVTVITYAVCIPFCLLFELPPIQLWKALTETDRRQESPQHQPEAQVKPLDLVANISRRQDV